MYHICFVYIYPLNGYRELNLFEEPFFTLEATTGLSDSKSLQVFRTLLSILTNLNNAIVWMASIRPPLSNSSTPPLSKPQGRRSNRDKYNCYRSHPHVQQRFF